MCNEPYSLGNPIIADNKIIIIIEIGEMKPAYTFSSPTMISMPLSDYISHNLFWTMKTC